MTEQRPARAVCKCPAGLCRCSHDHSDPVIPPEAVEAVARQVFFAKHGLDWDFVWFAEEKRAKAREDASEFALIGLQAAFPHLRPLFEVATQVGLELGRQEAAEEIADKCLRRAQLAERVPEGERSGVREGMERLMTDRHELQVHRSGVRSDGPPKRIFRPEAEIRREVAEEIARAAEADTVYDTAARYHFARIAREVATRTADARTDPSGHSDLPPTPDAGSKRLPEETGKGDSV